MGKNVDRVINKIQKSADVPKGRAIAIAKSQGLVKQQGSKLVEGPKMKKGK